MPKLIEKKDVLLNRSREVINVIRTFFLRHFMVGTGEQWLR